MNRSIEPPGPALRAVRPVRRRIGIAGALMLGFGGLVVLAVGLVLGLSYYSARNSTVYLVRALGDGVLDRMEDAVEHLLQPPRDAVDALGARIERGSLATDDAALRQTLAGTMAGLPQVAGLLWVTPDGRALRVYRQDGRIVADRIDVSGDPALMRQLGEAASREGPYWGRIVFSAETRRSLMNVRRPVRRAGRFAGVLVAAVDVSVLSRGLGRLAVPLGGEAFVLYDNGRVLAHRRLAASFGGASAAEPLPTIAELGDPVLAAFADPNRSDGRPALTRATGVHLVTLDDGRRFPLIVRPLYRFGAAPWQIGIYFFQPRIGDELRRLMLAGMAGIGVLIATVIAAWALARHVARPLRALSAAAIRVRDLRLEEVRPLKPSRIRELDEAAGAFDAMVLGLRWFETYVPKTLVRRLVGRGQAGEIPSAGRAVTVMFTDIAGFTALSERMSAAETAALLNRHFAALAHCIEAKGGTIDKFIGDAVMAFWGAPEEQADHAARAATAALAIRAAVQAENFERERAGLAPIRLRIGLHSGEAVVGNIGAPGRVNYTMVGDAVNLANRIEQLAKVRGDSAAAVNIVLSAATAAMLPADLPLRPLGAHLVRGRREPIELYTL
ncbi:MAG TPA: adenylate/guanylate cyclase domain-containing protein [Alphaproteobacteria bacterium]|jgi:class 3 adenylate cyclase|nr:adenylate/guanylate cyclase domain-containing protein [Alphaproteobacteria bacterium]